ncbi:MAG: hypothetical protein ABIJ41_07785 [Candidatus Omnitrophota bacterium]
MKKIILFIILSFLTASVAYCQDQPLQITIKSNKQVYEVGEEILIELKVVNIGNKEAMVLKDILWQEDALFSLRKITDSKFIDIPLTIKEPTRTGLYEHDFQLLASKESVQFENTVLNYYIGNDTILPAGTYQITVSYRLSLNAKKLSDKIFTGTLISNAIQIEVVGKESSEKLPHMMEGWDLYSWEIGNEWYFTLIPGTNRLKSYEDFVKAKSEFVGHNT